MSCSAIDSSYSNNNHCLCHYGKTLNVMPYVKWVPLLPHLHSVNHSCVWSIFFLWATWPFYFSFLVTILIPLKTYSLLLSHATGTCQSTSLSHSSMSLSLKYFVRGYNFWTNTCINIHVSSSVLISEIQRALESAQHQQPVRRSCSLQLWLCWKCFFASYDSEFLTGI